MSLKKKKEDQFWLEHYENWKVSGLKQQEYCSANGLSIHVFRTSVCKIRKTPLVRKSRFLSLRVERTVPFEKPRTTDRKATTLKLNFKEHFSIQIDEGFSQDCLFKVIKVLEKI
jgi:hypothetical protein